MKGWRFLRVVSMRRSRHCPDMPLRSILLVQFLSMLLSAIVVADEAFEVPEGFEVSYATTPGLVRHPMMGTVDPQGHLYVCEAAGVNLKQLELEEQRPNYISRLTDTDGDGVFDRRTTFADNMTFPQGCVFHDGSLYTASPPGIWRLRDTDGDGVADEREMLVEGFAYTGNAADVHGPFIHPNGRLYWCHGRKGHEVYEPEGGELVSKGRGARIWSCMPDGSDVQVFAGGGMDNPTELLFTRTGQILGTVNLFYGRPRGDVLVHWIRGGVYPRHDQAAILEEFQRTGELIPEVLNFGHVAVSGFTQVTSDYYGKDLKGDLFVSFFNLAEVQRVRIQDKGSGFMATTEPFLLVKKDGFHPTDVISDIDGSLLVVDTGGWFRIGCPTSQIARPEIHGGLYRIVPKGAGGRREVPSFANTGEEAVAALGGSNPYVVEHARAMLAGMGEQGLSLLWKAFKSPDPRVRSDALWVAGRIGSPAARRMVEEGLESRNAEEVQVACQVLDAANRGTRRVLASLLEHPEARVRREAATCLGRLGIRSGAKALLKRLKAKNLDRLEEHAVLFSLMSLVEGKVVLSALDDARGVGARRLLVLMAHFGEELVPDGQVARLMQDSSPETRGAAASVLMKRPRALLNWSEREGGEMSRHLEEPWIEELLARLLNANGGTDLFRGLLNGSPAERRLSLAVLKRQEVGGMKKFDEELRNLLMQANPEELAQVLEALGNVGAARFSKQLEEMGSDDRVPLGLRIEAGMLLVDDRTSPALFSLMMKALKSGDGRVLVHLGSMRLTEAQLLELAEAAPDVEALRFPLYLNLFNKLRNATVGKALLSNLKKLPVIKGISAAELKRLLTRFPVEVQEASEAWLSPLMDGERNQELRLNNHLSRLGEGDARSGRLLFYSAKAACSACHRIDGEGAMLGPDLSGIGRIRSRRDLLESILYPSASLARDFESQVVSTKDGEEVTGVVVAEDQESITLGMAGGIRQEIRKADIEDIKKSEQSLMPQGIEAAMTEGELADLLRFLETRRSLGRREE